MIEEMRGGWKLSQCFIPESKVRRALQSNDVLSCEGVSQMEPNIVRKDQITLVGMASYGGDIGRLWDAFTANDHLITHTVGEVGYELHAYSKHSSPGDPIHIFVGVEVKKSKICQKSCL